MGSSNVRRRTLILFWIVLCLWAGFALRLYRIDVQNIWWDEARNIDVAMRPVTAIATSPELDIHPPVYFYLLHLWTGIWGSSEFAVRSLSAFMGLLSAPLLWALARRLGGRTAAGVALGVGALSPFFLSEAQEARMYTTTFTWLLVAAYALLRAVDDESREEQRRALRWWGIYSLFGALSVLTHYSAVFVLVPWQLWIVARAAAAARTHGPRLLFRAILAGMGMLVLFLPQVPIALRQIPGYRNPNLVVPSWGEYLVACMREYVLGPALDLTQGLPWLWGIAVGGTVGLALGAAWSIRGGKARQLWGSALLVIWLIGGLAFYYLVLMDRSTFHPRYISFVAPALYALLALALAAWWRLWRPLGWAMALALLLVVYPAVQADQFDERYFREDAKGLAAWLLETANPDDLILIDVPYPMQFYYPRYARRGDPPAEPADVAPARYLFVNIHTIADELTALAQGRQRIFWVQWFKSDTDPRGVVTFLLSKFGHLEMERAFRGYRVDVYRLPTPAVFELAPGLEEVSVSFGPVKLTGVAFGGRSAEPTSDLASTRRRVVPADKAVWAVLSWVRVQPVDRSYKVSLFVEDPFGLVVGQDDRLLIDDQHLTLPYWSDGEVAINVYSVPLAIGSPPGRYTLKAAVYDPETGERLNRLDASGAPQGTEVTLGTFEVMRPLVPPQVDRVGNAAVEPVRWGDVTLLGAELSVSEAAPGVIIPVRLYWRAEADAPQASLVRVWLTTGGSAPQSVRESEPVDGGYPFDRWMAGEIVRDTHPWRLSADLPEGDYQVHVGVLDDAGQMVGETSIGALRIAGRPRRFDVPPIPQPFTARFGDLAELLGYDLGGDLHPGGALTVTLFWRALGASERPLTAFVHLLDGAHRLRAQIDRVPGDGMFPTTGWITDEILVDAYRLPLPGDLEPGEYQLEIGFYDPSTGARVPVVHSDGPAEGDAVWLPPIRVEARP